MRKAHSVILILLLLIVCSEGKIVVSIPDLKSVAERISGEEVETVLPATVDPHFYSISYQDLRKVENAEIVLLANSAVLGFESELKGICKNRCLDFEDYNALILEFPGIGYNPHAYWLLPENTLKIALALKNKLKELYPEKAEYYEKRYLEFESSVSSAKKDVEKLVRNVKSFDFIAIDPHAAYALSALGLKVSIAFPEEIGVSVSEIRKLTQFEKCILAVPDYQIETKVGEIAKNIAREAKCGIAKIKVVSDLSFESQLISNAYSVSNPIYLTFESNNWCKIISIVAVLEAIALVILWQSKRKI